MEPRCPARLSSKPRLVIYRRGVSKPSLFPHHFAELVQALALWTGLVPADLAGDLRAKLADPGNPFTKVTLSHYIYKLDALMMEPKKYYTCVEKHIMSVWGGMILEGATSFWETIDGGRNTPRTHGSPCP